MDLTSNLFSLLKQGGLLNKNFVKVGYSVLIFKLLVILYKEGYISNFKRVENNFYVYLKYYNGRPLVKDFKIYSTFGNKKYCNCKQLQYFFRKIDFLIISTSIGLLTKDEAVLKNIGGEVLVKLN